jgi:ATP adenylyltransferase
MANKCIFCKLSNLQVEREYKNFYSIKDQYPVTKDHTLIITKRHLENYFDLNKGELDEFNKIIKKEKILLEKNDSKICGFNIGINQGIVAGQTIMHCHIHLIPRRKSDTKNPRGGVRGVIPSKQNYKD